MTATRPYHHGNLRSALLHQAERALAEHGVEGLSLRELARELGVSNGAPRRHFADKQALLDALAEQGYQRLARELDAALADAGDDIAQKLVVFAQTYVDFAVEHRALLSLMHHPKDDSRSNHLREANDRAFAAPLRLLADARERGDIDPDTTGRVDMTLLVLLQGLTVLAATGMNGDRPLEVLVRETVETLLSGLRPR